MPSHEDIRQPPFSADEMFAVVADIEKYPEFVPGCAALKIIERSFDLGVETIAAKMLVSVGAFRETYTSKVTLDKKNYAIDAHHLEGPFHHLDTRWRFSPRGVGSEVKFFIDFEFRNRMLAAASNLLFDGMTRKMTDAFIARVEKLYATSHHAQQ
nr:MAG: type II toxin-antitoxin system RatA family toxin [Hyphomicrobiales bacterium]